jgi:hypothetical protein
MFEFLPGSFFERRVGGGQGAVFEADGHVAKQIVDGHVGSRPGNKGGPRLNGFGKIACDDLGHMKGKGRGLRIAGVGRRDGQQRHGREFGKEGATGAM